MNKPLKKFASFYASQHQELLEAILDAPGKKLDPKARQFIESFYALATVSNIEELGAEQAASVALACETFMASRTGAGPKLEVTTTRLASGHSRTVVMALNDDMPFLMDSLSGLFTSLGLTTHLVLHPILAVKRDGKGKLTKVERHDEAAEKMARESMIYMELSPLPVQLSKRGLLERMEATLTHVRAAVTDWKKMRETVAGLSKSFPSQGEGAEIRDLLHWLSSKHFVFLGFAEYRLSNGGLKLHTPSALGIYKLPAVQEGTIERQTIPTANSAIRILKATGVSLVHRHVPMDYIAIRLSGKDGKVTGEIRLLGLFTSMVYYRETAQIPFIRRKVGKVLDRAGFLPGSHSAKTLKSVLEFLPRDELFQVDDESLFSMAMRIISLEAKPQVLLFVRPDPFGRFISAIVYVPREQFSTYLRQQIARELERAYQGKFQAFYTQVSDSPLARVTILIDTEGKIPKVDVVALEKKIAALASLWSDALHEAVLRAFGPREGEHVAQSFANAFPLSYVNSHSAQAAAFDIRRICEARSGDGLALELFRAKGDDPQRLHLKCYSLDLQSELSGIIPLLENMGCTVVDVTPYIVKPLAPLPPVLMRDFILRVESGGRLDLEEGKARVEEAIGRIWRGQMDNDPLNALIFSAQVTARDVEILRAYSRYLQQANFPYSQAFIAGALNTHAPIAQALTLLFQTRFDPTAKKRDERVAILKSAIESALEGVTNLAEDRVIRRLLALIFATLRTNFYQRDEAGNPKPYLSLKLRSADIPELPLPVPYAEIFVTSMRVEGVHLRGGPVARGGLRWSDRPEDFRTEVLGLMKAQMVKNSVIVPQGAKGGFILRKAPAEHEALLAEGIACYQTFLRGLLDITDNIVSGKVVPPQQIVRHDGDDPYLVVAADKGTASFSDIANGLAAEYGFWLGDAFASGGSAGYDHKHMAITARGTWVAVERHFREMGRSMDEPFTAIGVGDMSGDVFGNGMLLSQNIRLVAAFNHRHIFIDPSPNEKAGFKERERLYKKEGSGWNDYDTALISKGGGVFARSVKSIKLTPEMRVALATEAQALPPDELIKLILKAPVDLLWNGGIGTYVKATLETHEQVGDRTNNNVRVSGRELRCKVVGEGGNLGFTQKGRIEYARAGGRINTDAIDNSGGVDCSDHEVNIKIALGAAVASGKLTPGKRNALLKKMTEEVASLVIIDNKLQTQAITIAQHQGTALLEPAEQLISTLEHAGLLNREVEFLPDAKNFGELRAAKQGLTRPEIAVLLAYAKMALFPGLKDSPLLDAPYFEADLLRYFPEAMQKNYAAEIKHHRLRRAIVATMITNSIVNRTGFAFAHHLMRATGLGAADIAQAYVATRDAFALRPLWTGIEALNVDAALQSALFARVNQFIEHSCRWFLQHVPQPMNIDAVMARYAKGIATVEAHAEALMTETLRKAYAKNIEKLAQQGVPEELAKRIAKLEILSSACDIVDVSIASKLPIDEVGSLYFSIGAQLKLGWMRRSAAELAADSYWQQTAIKSLVIELFAAQARITQEVIRRFRKAEDPREAWVRQAAPQLQRYLSFIEELRGQQNLDYSMLIVALRQVQWITSQ